MPRLTDDQKQDAVYRFVTGDTSQNQLAKEFGVAVSTIRSWREKWETAIRAGLDTTTEGTPAEVTLEDQADDDDIRLEAARNAAMGARLGRSIETPPGHLPEADLDAIEDAVHEQRTEDEELAKLRAENLALKEELKQFHPEEFEWGWTRDAIQANLQDHMDDLIANELASVNRQRLANGYAPIRPQEMGEEWYQRQIDKIVTEAMDALDSSGADSLEAGWADITLTMLDNENRLVQVILSDNVGNGPAARVQALKDKGYRVVTPQPCARKDCWLPPDATYAVGNLNFCGELHNTLYVAFQGQRRKGVTTSQSFDI